MSLSKINLEDSQSVRFDNAGRSAAYFCLNDPVKIDGELIAELKDSAHRLGDNNVRLCLHDSPDASFHEMINLEHRGKYYRPHKHSEKGESYHIIEGKMAAFIFDENGTVVDSNVLEGDGNFLYRVGTNMYHAVLPLSELIIYHESKIGPFQRTGDSIFPEWAPDGTDQAEADSYIGNLVKNLGPAYSQWPLA